ncbi:uncharacterized protein METZ01_LOCUS469706, partial [marine metagenome]
DYILHLCILTRTEPAITDFDGSFLDDLLGSSEAVSGDNKP